MSPTKVLACSRPVKSRRWVTASVLHLLLTLPVLLLLDPSLSAEVLTWERAFSRFLERNPTVLAEKEKLEIARGRLRQADVLPNPTLVYSQEGYPLGQPDVNFLGDQEFFIGGRQRLELGGKRERRVELAQLELEAEQTRYSDFLRLKRREVGRLFVVAGFAQQRESLLEKCHETYGRLREVHRKRLELGEVSPLAQMKIDVEKLGYLAVLAAANRELLSAWRELATLIVWDGREIPSFSILEIPASGSMRVEEMTEVAIRTRPDLAGQRLAERVSNASLRLEKAESVPDLVLGGGYKRDFGFDSFFLGLEIPLPIFDRKEGAIAERAAAVRRESNLSTWREMTVRSEVGRAYEAYRRLQESSQQVDPDLLRNLDRIVEITGLSYQEGEATILEYLDALRTQRDAAVNHSRLLQELQLAFLELEAATGVSLR
jgi:cobalt-zinc-cadmium efflux system outer membrane protein